MQKLFLGFTGDVMIGRLIDQHLTRTPKARPWGDLLPLLKKTDFNIINLEAALTHSEKRVSKTFNFKASPEKVKVLAEACVSVANLANNHVLDFSDEGLIETLEVLDGAKIQHVGAGKDIKAARCPVILEKNGIKIGVLGCTDNEPGWLAGPSKPGVNYLEVGNLNALQAEISALKESVDLIILSIHWGPNMRERPSRAFVNFAHSLIDAGVDILHGHSAHIFQGVEVYKGRLIFYDTGDFIDDYYVDPVLHNDRTFFFEVEVSKKGACGLRLTPACIEEFQVNLAKGQGFLETVARMRMLSEEFGTHFEQDDKGLFFKIAP